MTPWTTLVPGSPRIAVASAGRGPLVLFLHGIGGNRNHWQHQLAFFSQHGFRAAAWDARGYGDSDDYEGALQFEDFTSDVHRTIDFLGEPRVHLVGLSMGGRIARNVALRFPERLLSVTLVSTAPGFDALSPDQVRRFVTEQRNRTPETVRRLLGSRARKEAFDELSDSLARVREESYRKTLIASVAQDRDAPVEDIRVPTLIIAGDEDKVYPTRIARELAQRIPAARLVVMRGAGHLPNLERPGRFNEILLDFLQRRSK